MQAMAAGGLLALVLILSIRWPLPMNAFLKLSAIV